MDKAHVLEEAKKGLRFIVESINLTNIESKEEEIGHYLSLLKCLSKIKDINIDENGCVPVNCLSEQNVQEIFSDVEQEVQSTPIYRFERKLRGGLVPSVEGFIPESIVRSLGLEHGDYVYANELDTKDPNSRRFDYSLAEKGEGISQPDRIQLNYAVVTKLAGSLVVDSYIEGSDRKSIKIDGMPHTIVLNEQDINHFGIKEGCIIDLAYYNGFPDKHKVIWMHDSDRNEVATIESKAKTHNLTILKREKVDEQEEVVQTLKDKKVLVVGNEPKKALYKLAIESRGGEFFFADAKDKIDSFEPKIKKVDQVIFLLGVSGHIGMEHIKAICKQYGVPFDTTWSKGVTTITRLAESI